MSFDRYRLPDAVTYYESQGLTFKERHGKWRTTECKFHGGKDSLRVNAFSGGFVCMAGCGVKGGDVLAYHMAEHGMDFVAAAKDLGAWVDDGRPAPARPTPLPARDALNLLLVEANLVSVAAANIAHGVTLTDNDMQRLLAAASRIDKIGRMFA